MFKTQNDDLGNNQRKCKNKENNSAAKNKRKVKKNKQNNTVEIYLLISFKIFNRRMRKLHKKDK